MHCPFHMTLSVCCNYYYYSADIDPDSDEDADSDGDGDAEDAGVDYSMSE